MKKLLAVIVLVALYGLFFASQGRSQKRATVGEIMKAKLHSSQKVLEGVAVEDFDSIARHSQQLSLLSLDASWQVLQTEEYAQHSMTFRRQAHAIRDAAKKKNIDGAALAYVQLTLSCVECHKYVRSTRAAGVPAAEDAPVRR